VPIIRVNYAVQDFIRLFVVVCQRLHKTEVHDKFRATSGNTFSSVLCQLFANIGLFFEVDKTEWVIFKYWWCPVDMGGGKIQLTFTQGAESEGSNFGLDLAGPGSWCEF
jgi:hypothetical protein